MRVLVIGSTGGTGRATVQTLLDRGHSVTAFVRPTSSTDRLDPRATVLQGDALIPADLDRAMAGHDAVVIALGVTGSLLQIRRQRGLTTPIDIASRGTVNALAAMERQGIRRVVAVSGFGAAESWEALPGLVRVFLSTFLKAPFEDKGVQEAVVRASDAEWTILRPVGLTDKPATGNAFVSSTGEFRGNTIPRHDVAEVIAQVLETGGAVGDTLTLSV